MKDDKTNSMPINLLAIDPQGYASRGEIELALIATRDLPPEKYFPPRRDQWIRLLETSAMLYAELSHAKVLLREVASRLNDRASSSGSCGCRSSSDAEGR